MIQTYKHGKKKKKQRYSTTKLGHAQLDKEKRRNRHTVKTGRYIVLAAITGKLIWTPE